MKKLRYWIEHLSLLFIHFICKLFPWTWSSDFLGWLVSSIAPYMAVNRKPVQHIRAALQCTNDEALKISKKHWNNLGRVIAEFPNLKNIVENNVETKGFEHLTKLRDDGKCGILFGGHFGNWEVLPHAILHHAKLPAHPVYRAPNNPMVDKRLHKYRSPNGELTPYSKSRKGMAGMVRALKNGEHLGLLVDQKYNEGVTAQFFGMPAKTGVAFIELAQKFDCPLVGVRCVRKNNGFIIEAFPPIETKDRSTKDILNEVHVMLESWIKENPDQWLWVHRRWKKEDLRNVT